MAQKETVIIFGAHSDDFVIGAGGTIAKYSEEKKKIISIVFSYGENSHPWLKEKVVQEMRLKEAKNASKLLGCQTIFFDLKELHFQEEYEKKQLAKKLITLLNKEKPSKIFTHSLEDLHPDHKAIHNINTGCRHLVLSFLSSLQQDKGKDRQAKFICFDNLPRDYSFDSIGSSSNNTICNKGISRILHIHPDTRCYCPDKIFFHKDIPYRDFNLSNNLYV